MSEWKIFRGGKEPHDDIRKLPDPPPWRDFGLSKEAQERRRGETFQPSPAEVEIVNAALYLRRPLLVTGDPGCGKSSLAYAVARELRLGRVLVWPINSRSTLAEGVYRYDALARLHDAQRAGAAEPDADLARYLRLGPLGTALARSVRERPRVLLIDEVDKGDIDLANDLLHVLEEGVYEIPELVRIADRTPRVSILPSDSTSRADAAVVQGGRLQCTAFPFVLMTSNGERELPPAFLRRCLRLDVGTPTAERLRQIVKAHLGSVSSPDVEALLTRCLNDWKQNRLVATDQLLSALFLLTHGRLPPGDEREAIVRVLMKELSRE